MDVDAFKSHQRHLRPPRRRRALRAVADELQMALRPYDLCVRYAGDEFIVVLGMLAGGGRSQAAGTAGARRRDRDRGAGRAASAPAVSAGVGGLPARRHDLRNAAGRADQRMYRDKAARRGDIPVARLSAPAEFLEPELFESAD